EAELVLARRKETEAVALREEVEKRFRAGDVARLEINQARVAEQSAAIAIVEAQAKLARALQTFRGLTGLSTFDPQPAEVPTAADMDAHPALLALDRAADAARTRLAQVSHETRDPPEIAIGAQRERELAGEAAGNAVFMRFRLPFA